ncbi:MAG: histidine phosphatase family protein [Caldicoprobacter sp.]|uniref:histidine phosphatase family protein n=1 Tax=Caldicoprobacter sp. TaxID=2004500 RepID=UPI0039C35A50
MIVYITRHGETQWNVEGRTQGACDIGLTEEGRKQAYRLARRLKGISIRKIYCSDLQRALETASIIGREIGVGWVTTPLLREASFGEWEGHTLTDIERLFPGQLSRWYDDPTFCPPGGESLSCVRDRISRFVEQIKSLKLAQDESILVVSHALTCKVLILELMDLPLSYIKRIKQDNTGLTAIKVLPKGNMLIFLNETCHVSR